MHVLMYYNPVYRKICMFTAHNVIQLFIICIGVILTTSSYQSISLKRRVALNESHKKEKHLDTVLKLLQYCTSISSMSLELTHHAGRQVHDSKVFRKVN